MSKGSNTKLIVAVAVIAIIAVGAVAAITLLPPPEEEVVFYAFLLPGSITDSGWNAGMYLAAQKAEELLDIEIDITYGIGQVGVEDIYQEYIDLGADVIWGHTIQFVDPANAMAEANPDVFFGGSDHYYRDYVNVFSIKSLMSDGSFITGMLAGGLTNSGKVGYVGGFNYGSLRAYANAFYHGANLTWSARAEGSPLNLTVVWAGAWDDVDKGREAGQALINAGADVAQGRGNGMTLGAIQAFDAEDETYFFGDIADQRALAGNIVASNTVNFTVSIMQIEAHRVAGTLNNDSDYFSGMANGGNVVVMNPAISDAELNIHLSNLTTWVADMVADISDMTVNITYNETRQWP